MDDSPYGRLVAAQKRYDAAEASYNRQRELFAAADSDLTQADRDLAAAKGAILDAAKARAATA